MTNDARVAELEFLAFLDIQREALIISVNTHDRFHLTADRFKDMVFDLISENCATGTDRETSTYVDARRSPGNSQSYNWLVSAVTIGKILGGRFPYSLRITHTGRLRVCRLRDEIDRGRIYDQTGILVDGRHFDQDLRVRFAMAGPDVPVSVMMADLDHFKQVNDTLGHGRGDEALQRYFSAFRDIVTGYGGEAYRKGGDETIAILPNVDTSQAKNAAESVRRTIEAEFRGFDEGLAKPPTVSIGVASFTNAVDSLVVLRRVDELLYSAKKEGRNRVVVDTFERQGDTA